MVDKAWLTSKLIQADLQTQGTTVSARTIRPHLNEKGRYGRRPRRTPEMKCALTRLIFALRFGSVGWKLSIHDMMRRVLYWLHAAQQSAEDVQIPNPSDRKPAGQPILAKYMLLIILTL